MREPAFGERDRRDHAFVCLLRRIAKGEDPVLQQHESLDSGIRLEDLRGFLGEQKAGHDVGHETHPPAVQIRAALRRVGLIGEAQHRRRVSVVDIFVRQESVVGMSPLPAA